MPSVRLSNGLASLVFVNLESNIILDTRIFDLLSRIYNFFKLPMAAENAQVKGLVSELVG